MDIITKNFIKIPTFKKHILIGGKKYKELLKKGIVNGNELYKYDKNILFKIDLNELVQDKIKQFNIELPMGYKAVRGRGLYGKYIVKKKINNDDNQSISTILTEN